MACSSGVGALKTSDGSVVHSNSAKAELLNEYFVSVGTHDNGVLPDIDSLVTDDEDKIHRETIAPKSMAPQA